MSNIRKFLVAAAGMVVLVLSTILAVGPEIIPMNLLPWVQVIIALLVSKGVHAVRNVESVPSLYPSDVEKVSQ